MAAVALGSEIVVNALHAGNQYRPAITKLSTGGFVIAWQDESGTGSVDLSDDVRFARFDAFGNRLDPGIDKLANTTTASAQFEVSAAAFDNGKFVLAWTDASEAAPDFDNRAVRMQIFNENGTKSGIEIVVNTTFAISQDAPSVTVLTGGNIVVTWTSENINDSSRTDVIRRVFDSAGSPLTSEQFVNTQTVGDQERSTVHALNSGGFAVVWEDRENSIATGFQVETYIRLYTAAGSAQGGPLVLNNSTAIDPQHTGFAELTNGSIVLTWTEADPASPGDASGHSIRARIYNPATQVFGGLINVNTTTSFDQTDAQVAALDNGQFVVVWSDMNTVGNDTSFGAVRLQVFNSAGAKVGAELRVNDQTLFEQANPVVTVLDDFRFVVAWEDRSQIVGDTDGYAIHSRIFDARIAAINISGDANNNDFVGSNFGDTINGLGGNDKLFGGAGVDFLFGGIGADTLDGGSSNDTMNGGDGNDIYYVDNVSDVIVEAPGVAGGIDYIYSTVTYTIAANCERLYLTGAANLNANGRTGQNDILIGNNGANTLDGKGGADLMRGGLGNDIYYVDHAGDTTDETNGGGGIGDYVHATVSFTAAAGIERLYLDGAGNINATGRAGQNDILIGNNGANTLDGLSGNDVMRGGLGNDTYYIDSTSDTTDETTGGGAADYAYASVSFTAAAGIERLYLTGSSAINATGRDAQADFLIGNNAANTLTGLTGNDILSGGLGVDTLIGGVGNDTLIGGLGNDILTGGADSDFFRFDTAPNSTTNKDSITDFNPTDTIQLDNAVFTALGATGALTASMFKDISLDVLDASDRIIYNRALGQLLYDVDGPGGVASVIFATVSGNPVITAADFVVI